MKPNRTRLLAGAALALAAAAPAQAPAASTLEAIRARGALLCGVNTGLAGFAAPDGQGVWRGFDVDYCRAVAIALFGDPNRVRFVPTTAQLRCTELQSGEVDMLSRNTSWTFSRDTALGFDFPAITFYDGQGFMVQRALGVQNARQLDGATVCVQPATTSEQNLADWARGNRINIRPVVLERLEDSIAAYNAARCDAYTTSVSGLAAVRAVQPRPEDHVILPEVISKQPLGPLLRHGDQRFADLLRWTPFDLIAAEEFGITAANAEQALASDARPEVQRMLGGTGELGRMLGIDNAWLLNVLRGLGNYGELFERNLGPIGLQRGRNALWTQPGGLHYAPAPSSEPRLTGGRGAAARRNTAAMPGASAAASTDPRQGRSACRSAARAAAPCSGERPSLGSSAACRAGWARTGHTTPACAASRPASTSRGAGRCGAAPSSRSPRPCREPLPRRPAWRGGRQGSAGRAHPAGVRRGSLRPPRIDLLRLLLRDAEIQRGARGGIQPPRRR